jgi:hypothetical protein
VEDIYFGHKKSLLANTATWFTRDAAFQAWEARETQLLWLLGGAGLGKSFISTAVIQQLLAKRDEGTDSAICAPVAYFFCKEDHDELRDPNIILKTLAWQMQTQDSSFRQHVVDHNLDRRSVSDVESTWNNLFMDYFQGRPERSAVVVLDGLDEALPSRRLLLQLILKYKNKNDDSSLFFLLVGRPDITEGLDWYGLKNRVWVTKTKNQDDIKRYASKRLVTADAFQRYRKQEGSKKAQQLGSIWMKKILDGADGVFLWARLLLDEIQGKDLPYVVRALATPPTTLDSMIDALFKRLYHDKDLDQDWLRRLLLHTAYSKRPVLVGELDVVLSSTYQTPSILLWDRLKGKLASLFDLRLSGSGDSEMVYEYEYADYQETGQDDQDGSEDDVSDMEFDLTEETDDSEVLAIMTADFQLDDGAEFDGGNDVARVRNMSRQTTWKYLTYLDENQCKTSISFSHERILYYIRRNINPSEAVTPQRSIIPDPSTAQLEMTLNCLKILRLKLSFDDSTRYLDEYPAMYLAPHLEAVEPAGLTNEQLKQVLEKLYWLFATDDGTLCFIKTNEYVDDGIFPYFAGLPPDEQDALKPTHRAFWRSWAGTDRYLKVVQSWFAMSDRVLLSDDTDGSARAWMQAASKSYASLLRPLILSASKMWYVRTGYDDERIIDKGRWVCFLVAGWVSLVSPDSLRLSQK